MPKLSPTRISLIRHGHVHNPQDIIYGRLSDFHLSALGRRQVRAAAEALRGEPVAALFSSPLLRAQQSAAILAQRFPHLPVQTSLLLNEVHTCFEGRPASEGAAQSWDIYSACGPGYEQMADLVARVRRFFAEMLTTYPGQHVAAVSHGDVIACTTLWACGQALEPANKLTLDRFGVAGGYPATASISTFTYHDAAPDAVPAFGYRLPYGESLARAQLGPAATPALDTG